MRALVLAIGLACAALPASPAVAKPQPVVRFTTYNVCKTSCGTGKFDWQHRSKAVVRNILSAKPDVLALQEVDNSYGWIANQLKGHGYAHVEANETSCTSCINDSHLYYRTSKIAPVTKETASEPIPDRCAVFFPKTPGVLFESPDEPDMPDYPTEPSPGDPDYARKMEEYDRAVAEWDALDQQLGEAYRAQYAAYLKLLNQYRASDCSPYVGWTPTSPRGSGEVALSSWGNSDLGRSVDDRSLTWAVFKVKATGAPFVAVSMHLPNEKTPDAEKYRKVLAQAIPTRLKQIQSQLGIDVPTVMMGDLNSYWQRQPRGAQWVFGKAGFTDAYTAHKRVNGDVPTVNVTSQLRNPFPAKPFHFDKPARLDYVLFNRGRALRYEVHLRLKGKAFDNNYRGSDHNMVLADLRLPSGALPGGWN